MSDLTDADLEAMEKRCEAATKEWSDVRFSLSTVGPGPLKWTHSHAKWYMDNLYALIAALRAARAERDTMAELYAREGHKSLVLLNENTSLLAENRLLVACLNSIRCLAVEGIGAEWEELAPKVVSIYATCIGPELVPLTAAEVARVQRLEKVAEAAKALRSEHRADFMDDGARQDRLYELFQLLDEHDEAAALAELDAGEGTC